MLTRGSGEREKKGDNGQISSQKKNNSCPLPPPLRCCRYNQQTNPSLPFPVPSSLFI